MLHNIFLIKENILELSLAIHGGLVIKMGGGGVAAFASGNNGFGFHFITEFYNGNKAISNTAVHSFRPGIFPASKRCKGAPEGGSERHCQTGFTIVKYRFNISRQSLKAVDISPRLFPISKILFQIMDGFGKSGYFLMA